MGSFTSRTGGSHGLRSFHSKAGPGTSGVSFPTASALSGDSIPSSMSGHFYNNGGVTSGSGDDQYYEQSWLGIEGAYGGGYSFNSADNSSMPGCGGPRRALSTRTDLNGTGGLVRLRFLKSHLGM